MNAFLARTPGAGELPPGALDYAWFALTAATGYLMANPWTWVAGAVLAGLALRGGKRR